MKSKKFSTALIQLAMVASPLSLSAAASAYYSGRRGAYGSGSNKTYLVDPALVGLPKSAFNYSKVHAGNAPAQPLVSGDELVIRKSPVKELLVVDRNIKDYRQFSRLVKPGVELVEIPQGTDGLVYLLETLEHYENLHAVHLFSHARAGELLLGNTPVDGGTLKSHPEFARVVNGAIKTGGDFLLYGCELGKGEAGDEFLEIIKSNTHADVAASDNRTGNAAFNGDWDLEIQKGDIEAKPLANSVAMKDFTEVLQTTTIIFDQSNYITGSGAPTSGIYNSSSNAQFNVYANGTDYVLTADGESGYTGNVIWDYLYNEGGNTYIETKTTFSFSGNAPFKPKSISLWNLTTSHTQDIFITTDNGGLVTVYDVPKQSAAGIANLDISGLPVATKLIITGNIDGNVASNPGSTGEGAGKTYLRFDQLQVDDLGTATAAPTACAPSIGVTDFEGLYSSITELNSGTGSATATVQCFDITSETLNPSHTARVVGTSISGNELLIIQGVGTSPNANLARAIIKSNDGSEFSFRSIKVQPFGNFTDWDIVYNGYKDGVLVSGASLSRNDMSTGVMYTDEFTSIPAFGNVDEIRIEFAATGTSFQNFRIDDIEIGAATATPVNTAPTLTASAGTTAFIEGTAIAIDNALTVTDTDNTTLASATVSISGNFQSGQDVLVFTSNPATMGNITISSNNAGVLTLTSAGATATLAQWQTALRSITYNNTSDNPNTANRTVSFVVNDGTDNSTAATKMVSVTAASDDCIISATIADAANEMTNDLAHFGQSFTACGNGTLSKIKFLSRYNGSLYPQDLTLTIRQGNGLSGDVLGTVTIPQSTIVEDISGTNFTVVDVSSQNIAISNGQFYTFSFEGVDDNRAQLNFGKWILQSAFESFYPGGRMYVGSVAHDDKDLIFEVEIEAGSAPVNTAPSATNLTQSKSFTEDDGSAVALDDIVVTDPDAGETIAATLTLSNVAAGSLSTGTYGSATSTFASGVWTVSGSVADVNVALAAVAFSPAANFDQDFTITARIRDATDTGPADGTISISVTAVNDAPTATNLTQSKSATEGGSAVALDDMVITDPDTGETITATLTLSNTAAGSLSTGTYGSATSTFASGVWTVTGSVADVNGALAAMAFTPSADNDQNFTITTRIRDAADTGPADGTISFMVTPVNDAPVITAPATIAVTEDIETALIGISFVDVDAGSGNVTVTLAVASGSLSATTGAGVTVGGTASARTLTGTIADVNTFIAASNVTYTTALNATSNVTLTVSINDNGNTGTGEAQQDSEMVTLLVTAVNDAPVITAPESITVTEDQASALMGISFADVDAGSAAATATLSVASGSLSAIGGLGVTVGGTSSALTLTGSMANINSFIAASNVTYTTALNATTDVTLTVSINDNGNTGSGGDLSVNETVTLQVTPVNDAPTDITLSAGTILQSLTAAGTEVGTLSTTDVDDGEVFTYTLNTTGTAGGTCTDDSGNGSFQLNGNVLETAGPLLPGTYNICVQTSDGEADFRKSFTITVDDDVPPVVSSVSVPADSWYVAGGTLSFTVNTNEAVTVDTGGGTPRIALTVGEETVYASYQSGSGTSALVFAYTVVSGNLDNDGIEVAAAVEPNGGTLRDAADNFLTGTLNGVGATTGVLVDAVAPTLQSLSPADGSTTVVPGADFRMTFSENIALGSGNIVIYGALYSPVAIIDAAAHGGQLSITDNQLTINPAADLNELNSYYIQVASGAVTDLAGNAYAGISDLTTWNFTVADVTPPTVTAVAVNGTPSASAEEIQFTVTFDEAPDNVTVDDFTLTRTGSPGGNIADASLSTGNTVTVTIDGIAGAGTLRLDVKANSGITDAFGNGNGTNGYVPAFTGGGPHVVDREAPNAPEGLALDPASDSGEGDDGITNDNTPTLTGTAEANATLTVTSDVDGELGTATADGSGNWSYTPGIPLTEGMHNLTATATDAAGNTSAASAALEITIDTTPHAKPAVPDLAAASDTGESDTDNITNLTDLTLQGAAGSVEAHARVHARSDLEGGLTNTTANADGSWSLDVSGLMEGPHQLQITATDTAGNTSVYSDALMVVIDTTAPAGHSVSVDDDVINATEAASIGFTFSEAEAGAVYSYSITSSGGGTPVTGTGTLMTTTDPISGIDVSGLRDGTLTLSVTVTDVAGNSAIAVTDASMLDQAVPEVEGVENGEYYNEDVTPTFNEGTATLNGEAFTSGTLITDEDNYTLVVTDAAGNADTVNFVVDKTLPEITDVEDGASYNTDVTPAFNEGTAMLNGEAFTSGTVIADEDEYTLVVTDAAGNADTVRFTIDKTLPEITGAEDGASYNTDVTPVFNEGTATLNGEAFTSGTVITDEDAYILIVTDAAGNADTVNFVVDKTLPEITGVEDGASYNTDVTPAFNEGTATLNGEAFTSGTVITDEDNYTLVVTDAAGNADTVNFVVDKTVPEITGVDDGASHNTDVTPVFNEGTATLNGETFTSGTVITDEDNYTLVVTDAAGNADTVNFVVDKTVPEITGVEDGASYNTDVTPIFNEGTATLNGEAFTSGTPITEEGDYTLLVTDAAGNETTISFTVDKTAPDTTPPAVSGVEDGGLYNHQVTPVFTEGTAMLNGDAFESGTPVAGEGMYTLVVADSLNNADAIRFRIDLTAPVITGVADGGVHNGPVTPAFNEGTATLNGEAFTSGTPITEEGDYTLLVTDAAGNETAISFTIDKAAPDTTPPAVSGVEDGGLYNQGVTPVFTEGTAMLNGDAFVSGTPVTGEGMYTLVVADSLNNADTVRFRIDLTAPVITGVVDGGLYAGAASASFTEGTATLNGAPYTSGTPITTPGEYTLTVTDAAGNETVVRFTVGTLAGAPTGLHAEAGNRQVMLVWDAPADVIPAVTNYVIEYSANGGTTWTVPDREPSAATRSLVIGLTNNRSYLFRVSAVNGVGTGSASGTVQAIPTEPVPDDEGNLPEPEPGIPVVITDGKVEAVMLEVVDSEYLRLSGDGYAMELASLGVDGERIPISAIDAVIRLLKGNGTQVYVSGNGFEPGTVVTVYLFSTPELVGHLPVGADGRFGGSLPVPANLELGQHTLQANGVVAGGGGERSVSVGLELVDRRPQWVELGALADRTYGDDAVILNAESTSGLPVTYTVMDADGKPTDIVTLANNNRLTIRGAGDILITATQAGNADYSAAAPVSRTLHIAKAPLAVRTSDATRAYGEENPAFGISYSGLVNGDDASALDTRPTAATEATVTAAPGSYAVTVSGGVSSNYAFTYEPATLTITKADQSITLNAPAEVNRNAGSIQLDVSASSGLPVTLSIDDEQVATVSGNTLNILRLGTVTITATQTGDGNHEAAEPVTVTVRVTDPSSGFPIRVHQAVSPNGDGINEFLMIEGIRDYADNRVTIISRNGTVLWEASGYDNDRVVFRGISTGQQQLPAGTYFYIVEVKVGGKWEHRKGYFVLRY